jgi:hypothetical protein
VTIENDVPQRETRQSCSDLFGTTRKHLLTQTSDELKELKKLKCKASEIHKQSDPLYDRLKSFHDHQLNEVTNTTTERLSKEVLDVVADVNAIGGITGGYQWSDDEKLRLNELNRSCKLLQPRNDWTWGAPDNTDQGIYNDKRFQFCVQRECEVKIIECTQCMSTGVLVGLDQVRSTVCYECLKRGKGSIFAAKNEAWKKVRSAFKVYFLYV